MTAIYENDGIRFVYPENWTLEDPPDDEADLQVTVSSPETAFWSLSRYPGLRDLREVAGEVLQAMQAEYPTLESDPADTIIDGTSVVGYDMSFYCLDLTNTAQVRVFHRQGATCLMLCQAEDREFQEVQAVFDAMTTSLLQD